MFKLTPVTSKIGQGHPSSNLTKTLLRYIHGISLGPMRLIFVELSCLQAKCWRTDRRTDRRTNRRTDQSNSRLGYTQPAQKYITNDTSYVKSENGRETFRFVASKSTRRLVDSELRIYCFLSILPNIMAWAPNIKSTEPCFFTKVQAGENLNKRFYSTW